MGQKLLITSVDPACPIPGGNGIGCGGGIIRDDDFRYSTEVVEGQAVRGQPAGLALIKQTMGEDQPGVRQGGDEDADLGGFPADRVDQLHCRSSPIDLASVSWDVVDPGGQALRGDVTVDELPETFIAVVPKPFRCGDVQVVGPQDVEWGFLPADSGFYDGVDVDGDEFTCGGGPAIADHQCQVFIAVAHDLGFGGEIVLVECFTRFSDRGVCGTAVGLDCPV